MASFIDKGCVFESVWLQEEAEAQQQLADVLQEVSSCHQHPT